MRRITGQRYSRRARDGSRQGEGRVDGADRQRWLLGRLRRRTLYSLAEVDEAIGEMLKNLNEERRIRRLGVTRRQLLEKVDRSELSELPVEPYEYCEWRLRESASIITSRSRLTTTASLSLRARRGRGATTVRGVEIFCKGERIAVHLRMRGNRKHKTITEHMPSRYRRYAGWKVERIRENASKIGYETAAL